MFALEVVDFFYTPGWFLGIIDPAFALAGLLGIVLILVALIGNLARLERRVLFIELDALFLIVVYVAGMYLLYSGGIGMWSPGLGAVGDRVPLSRLLDPLFMLPLGTSAVMLGLG